MKKTLLILLLYPIISFGNISYNGLSYDFSIDIPKAKDVIMLFSFDNYTKQYHMEEDPYKAGHFFLNLDINKTGESIKPGKYYYRIIADGIMTYDSSNPNVEIFPRIGKISYFYMKDQYLDNMTGPVKINNNTYRFFYHSSIKNTPKEVLLAGDFNYWNLYDYILVRSDKNPNIWYIDVTFDHKANIQYMFIVDGKWVSDVNNPSVVRNAVGQDVSVFKVQ